MRLKFPHRILKFTEISYLPEALFLLFLLRLKVSFCSSRNYLPTSDSRNGSQFLDASKINTSQIIAYAINGLSSRTPWRSTCLVKALAAHKMLKKRIIPHNLHFGINKDSSEAYHAHAWLSVNDIVIIGGENNKEFTEIAVFNY